MGRGEGLGANQTRTSEASECLMSGGQNKETWAAGYCRPIQVSPLYSSSVLV